MKKKDGRLLGGSQFILWGGLFLFLTAIALTNFTREVTSNLAEGEPGKYAFFFIMETTGAYTLLFLVAPLLWFFKRFPLKKGKLAVRIPFYFLVSMVYGASHTMLMYLSRLLIFWMIGWGTYNYGIWKYRFPMEYTHQILTFLYILLAYYLIQTIREKQEQKLRTSQLEQKLTRARLQALQTQLNPHFFFNTLNMISSTMYEDVKAADKMIADLSDILRITLKRSSKEEYTLEKELEILTLYIEIMKARFRDKLSVNMDIGPETRKALLPQFLLQPLVENSIKHSIETLKKTEIQILSRKVNRRLVLEVKDNGPGVSGDVNKIIRNGIGLSNTLERLEKLYGDDHEFFIQNREEGGLKVKVEIPFHPEVRIRGRR